MLASPAPTSFVHTDLLLAASNYLLDTTVMTTVAPVAIASTHPHLVQGRPTPFCSLYRPVQPTPTPPAYHHAWTIYNPSRCRTHLIHRHHVLPTSPELPSMSHMSFSTPERKHVQQDEREEKEQVLRTPPVVAVQRPPPSVKADKRQKRKRLQDELSLVCREDYDEYDSEVEGEEKPCEKNKTLRRLVFHYTVRLTWMNTRVVARTMDNEGTRVEVNIYDPSNNKRRRIVLYETRINSSSDLRTMLMDKLRAGL